MFRKPKIRSYPLIIRNPFWTGFANLPSLPVQTTILDLPEPLDLESPQFFKSVEARDKALEIQRAIERQNARAWTEKEAKLRRVLEAENKRKEKYLDDKIIQYYAEYADEGGIPPEYQEEVMGYYKQVPGAEARHKAYLESLIAKRRKQEDLERQRYFHDLNQRANFDTLFPEGAEGRPFGYGWRARPLHTLLRPYKHMEEDPTPKEQVEHQQEEIDARQNHFTHRYEDRYGKPPSHETTKQAMPELAAPVTPSAFKLAQMYHMSNNRFI